MFWLQKWKLSLASFAISSLIFLIYPLSTLQSQQIVLNPDPARTEDTVNLSDLEKTRQIVNHRLQNIDLPRWSRTSTSIEGNAIVVTVPKSIDQAAISYDLTRSGEVALIETGVEFPTMDGIRSVKTSLIADPENSIYQILLQPTDFQYAQPLLGDEGAQDEAFGLIVTLSSEGAERLGNFLENRQGLYLCMTQDNVVVGCPIVKLIDETQVEIRQGPTDFLIETDVLIDHINAGSLPIPLVSMITDDS